MLLPFVFTVCFFNPGIVATHRSHPFRNCAPRHAASADVLYLDDSSCLDPRCLHFDRPVVNLAMACASARNLITGLVPAGGGLLMCEAVSDDFSQQTSSASADSHQGRPIHPNNGDTSQTQAQKACETKSPTRVAQRGKL